MTPIKCLTTLLIIASLLHEHQLQQEACSLEEVAEILQKNINLLDENLNGLHTDSDQKLADARKIIADSLESSPALIVLSEINELVDRVKSHTCGKQLQAKLDLETVAINLLQDKCVAKSKKNELSIENKINSAVKKFQSLRRKAELALEKCTLKNSLAGCPVLESCSQLAVIQLLLGKVESGKYKIDNGIEKLIAQQNSCLRKVANKTVVVKEELEEEVLACSLQEPGSHESELSSSGSVQYSESNSYETAQSTESAVSDTSNSFSHESSEEMRTFSVELKPETNPNEEGDESPNNQSVSVEENRESDSEKVENDESEQSNDDNISTTENHLKSSF